MHITILSLLLGLLLLLVPAYVFYRLDRRFLRQSVMVMGRVAVALLLLAVCFYYLFEWNLSWLNVLWTLVSSAVAAAVYCRKRSQYIPILAGMTVSTYPVGLLALLLMGVDSLLSAMWFIPVMALLQADALMGARRGLRAYMLHRRQHHSLYEYLQGNGATPMEALRPFITKAVTRTFAPALLHLKMLGLVFLPPLLCGLLMGAVEPLQAVAFLAVMTAAMSCSTMLAMLISIYVYEKLKS